MYPTLTWSSHWSFYVWFVNEYLSSQFTLHTSYTPGPFRLFGYWKILQIEWTVQSFQVRVFSSLIYIEFGVDYYKSKYVFKNSPSESHRINDVGVSNEKKTDNERIAISLLSAPTLKTSSCVYISMYVHLWKLMKKSALGPNAQSSSAIQSRIRWRTHVTLSLRAVPESFLRSERTAVLFVGTVYARPICTTRGHTPVAWADIAAYLRANSTRREPCAYCKRSATV